MALTHPRTGTGVALALTLALLGAAPRLAWARDPCALLTADEVSDASGKHVGAGQPIGKTGCQWIATGQGVMITISLLDAAGFASGKRLPGVARTPAAGFGDEAVFTRVGPLVTFAVRKGDGAFVVRVYGIHDLPRQEDVERTLARDALARW